MIARARAEAVSYALLRIVIGFLFLFHGIQKLFGEFTAKAPPHVGSQMWFGGIIELVSGVLVCAGLFTRPAAFLASGMTAVAYWQFHAIKNGSLLPIVNGGELAVLYCFAFLFIAARGAGEVSLDRALHRA
jgi:putative oxidoreductase